METLPGCKIYAFEQVCILIVYAVSDTEHMFCTLLSTEVESSFFAYPTSKVVFPRPYPVTHGICILNNKFLSLPWRRWDLVEYRLKFARICLALCLAQMRPQNPNSHFTAIVARKRSLHCSKTRWTFLITENVSNNRFYNKY